VVLTLTYRRRLRAASGRETEPVDPILYWNDVVNEADRTTHTTRAPQEAGAHDPYLSGLPTPAPDADVDSAVAAAAHATLSALYPAQRAFFDAQLAAAGRPARGPASHKR
jgi:hypothetical protein